MSAHTNGSVPSVPEVSVVLPVFNGASSVECAVQSVRKQSFPNWELLAVDDGSTDGTYEKLSRLAASDSRIRVLRSEENRGAPAARNRALREVRGGIITYLDCLDEYSPDYLAHVRDWPKEADICVFCYDVAENGSPPEGEGRRLSWDPLVYCERLREANITSLLAVAHRRELLERVGLFEEKFRHEEDWDLLKRFARAGAAFLFLPVRSGLYHVRPGNRTRTRRLADQAWQGDGALPAPQPRPPRLVRYTDGGAARQRAAAEQAESHFGQATALAQHGQRGQAIALFRQALALKPDHARAHHNLGVALAEENKPSEALTAFREAARLQPHYPEAHYCLGNTLMELGRLEEGLAAYREAIRQKPDFADALNNLGLALTRLGRPAEAAIFLRQAVRLQPDQKGHNNLGLAYLERADFARAEQCFEEALRLNPRYPDAHTNLGSTFKEQGRLEEAMACYELALTLEPGAVTPHWNQSLALLQMGNFEQGWVEYEWRWQRKETAPLPFTQPRWDGSPLAGRTILLHVEQGLGDMVQFIRYAPLVKERGGRVLVAAPATLVELFASCGGVDQVVPEHQELPPFDVHAPLMSLPNLFGTTVSTIPARVPYLTPEPARVERWRERLKLVQGFKVGIAWQGNPRHKWDKHRSIPLALYQVLAGIEGIALVSIQKGPGAEQLAFSNDRTPALDLGPELTTFSDTAALMQCLDLVISCDTSVAHLAGALGVPVWVALGKIVDWRWLLEREDSPWYPSMWLFRQERLGDWEPVLKRMARELRKQLADGRRKKGESKRDIAERALSLAAVQKGVAHAQF